MARQRDAERERGEGEGKRGAQRGRKSPSGTFGLAIVLVVLGAALGLFLLTNRKQAPASAPAAAEPVNPFADLPPETPPEKQARPKGQR